MRKILALILSAGLLAACVKEQQSEGRDDFALSGKDIAMGTKAAGNFDLGDSYWFFAFNHSQFVYPAVIHNQGTESAQNSIDFPEGTMDHFGGNAMDFYGLTYGDSRVWDESDFTETDGQHPRYSIARDAYDNLEDLRLGRKENVTSANSSGRVEVEFHHALSRLHFTAARQNATNLEGIYITSISIKDYSEGTLDMVDGSWSHSSSPSVFSIYSYNPVNPDLPSNDKKLDYRASPIADALVFPSPADVMTVHVETYNPTLEGDGQSNDSKTPSTDFTIPVEILANHEYTLSITITNKGVRIIILTPEEAEWIEKNQGDVMLGQPVTFGGVTWSDRNLGATFAPEGNKLENIKNVRDWDNMRGYYFQFGRNVPYFVVKNMKMSKPGTIYYSDFENNDYTYSVSFKDRTNATFAFLDGQSVQEAYDAIRNKKDSDWKSIEDGGKMPLTFYKTYKKADLSDGTNYIDPHDFDRSKPNDANRFALIAGGASDEEPWWSDLSPSGTPTTWNDVSNQPCPKGWRIPTRDDWAYIMPLSKRTGDITFNKGSGNSSKTYTYKNDKGETISEKMLIGAANSEYANHYVKFNKGVDQNGKDVAWWAETGGDRYDVSIPGLEESLGDPFPGYVTKYLCVAPLGSDSKPTVDGVLYAIKYYGTSEAYRLKWEFVVHKDMPIVDGRSSKNRPVTLKISRYTSDISEELETLEDMEALDWDHPTEIMELPDCGYLFSEYKTTQNPAFVNPANESIYASSTIDPKDGYFYAVRLKYNTTSTASRYLMLIKMRRAYGMCIRPVMDNSVIIE